MLLPGSWSTYDPGLLKSNFRALAHLELGCSLCQGLCTSGSHVLVESILLDFQFLQVSNSLGRPQIRALPLNPCEAVKVPLSLSATPCAVSECPHVPEQLENKCMLWVSFFLGILAGVFYYFAISLVSLSRFLFVSYLE